MEKKKKDSLRWNAVHFLWLIMHNDAILSMLIDRSWGGLWPVIWQHSVNFQFGKFKKHQADDVFSFA